MRSLSSKAAETLAKNTFLNLREQKQLRLLSADIKKPAHTLGRLNRLGLLLLLEQ